MSDQRTQQSLDYAFKYFDLHAKQRMTVFNFFLVIAGILTGGIAASLTKDAMPLLAIALSVVLILISVVFWKLDARTSFLIKHAESALIASEAQLEESSRLITSESGSFEMHRREKGRFERGWKYSRCFRIVFGAMIVIGGIGLVLSTARWSQLTRSDAANASRGECVWRVNLGPDSTINVEQLNRCSNPHWASPNTNTSVAR